MFDLGLDADVSLGKPSHTYVFRLKVQLDVNCVFKGPNILILSSTRGYGRCSCVIFTTAHASSSRLEFESLVRFN